MSKEKNNLAFENTARVVEGFNQPKKKQRLTKEQIENMRAKDRQPVKGIFRFYECPGATFMFSYLAYKGDEIENFSFIDNGVYTIPLGVARHLNKNCNYPIHAYQMDADGRPVARIAQRVQRVGFQSLEFIDEEDLSPTGKPELVIAQGLDSLPSMPKLV